jgi:hypothetical protein
MPSLTSVFVGVPQSKLAGVAIMVAVIVVALSILFGREPIPMTQKFVIVLVMFLLALPAILLSLFQINCLVTGAGFTNQRWWCSLYAWVISIMVVFYCVMLVVVGLLSYTDDKKVVAQEKFRNMQKFSNRFAEGFFAEAGASAMAGVSPAAKAVAPPTLPEMSLPLPPAVPTAGAPEPPMEEPNVPVMAPPAPPMGPAMPAGSAAPPQGFQDYGVKEGFGSCGAPYGSM